MHSNGNLTNWIPDLLIRLKFLLGRINKMARWEVIWTDHG